MRVLLLATLLTGCSHLQLISELEDRRDNTVEAFAASDYNLETRRRALLALGRIQAPATARIIEALGEPELRDDAAFAAGLLGLSWEPLPPRAQHELTTALEAAEPSDAVLTALGRLGAYDKLIEHRALLQLGLAIKRGAKLDVTALALEALKDADDRVRYGAAYALAVSKKSNACLHDRVSEIRALCAKGADDAEELTALLKDRDPRVVVEAQRSLIRLKRLPEPPTPSYGPDDPRTLDQIAEAKATDQIPRLRGLLGSSDPIVAAAAANALARLGDRESIPKMREIATLRRADIAPVIADALAEVKAVEAVEDLQQWFLSTNATVRHSAAAAIRRLTGWMVFAPQVALPQAAPIPASGSGLRIVTAKGTIEIELWNDEAPRTAANLWSLAQRKFFDGLTFHRVVPDFVIQGGDPRGDGEGGPGYMIRCEIGHRPFVRGTVGMALSGKDTGGSQFFITHTATPHLDGKYTAFGQVTRGMEIVDAIVEGDRIERIEAVP
jgi:cyclophilin family peptidyl-prolyl cis-trans isomerase